MILPSFDVLARTYPTGDNPDAVRMAIGGTIARMPAGSNTCVIRMCRAFNYSGKIHEIPGHGGSVHMLTQKGGDGKNYALRVAEFLQYLSHRYGRPSVSVRYKETEVESVTPFLGTRGIIAWHVSGWSDATGHFTLWDGQKGLYEGGEDYFSTQWFPRTVRVSPTRTRIVRETGVDLWRC